MKPLIICVAGKKQTGKNTTGELIQKYLWYCKGIIESFGFDTTVESYWHREFRPERAHSVHQIEFGSFAEPLKEHCIQLGLVTDIQCFGSEKSKNTLARCWKGDRQLTAREVLQEVGQFHRELNSDCWVNALDAEYRSLTPCPALYIITDGRYPNELQWVKSNAGKVIYLRSETDTGNHPSEKSLSPEKHKDLIDLVVPGKDLMPAEEREKLIVPVVKQWFEEYGLIGKE